MIKNLKSLIDKHIKNLKSLIDKPIKNLKSLIDKYIKNLKSLIDKHIKIVFFSLIVLMMLLIAGLSFSLHKGWILIIFLLVFSFAISLYIAFWGEKIFIKKNKEKK